jgi:uncharacterized protein YqeY
MTIYEQLNKKLKEAMIAKDEAVKNYVRSLKARLTEYEVANGLSRDEMPNDKLVVTIISAHKKSLEKAVKQLEKGGDASLSLVTEYKGEIRFCEQFLPDESELEADIEHIVDEAISNVGNNVGKVMGYVMKNNKSLDGATVKAVVMKKLQG